MNNMMPPLQANADDLARYGRYGDSMLVHMNPAEVQGIAALSPTGQLTTNPVTGQPEAFLPFLAPLLAKFVPAALTKVGLGGLGAAAASAPGITSAITSGLITGVAEGDLEKGIMAGITSFGMGKALGAASDAAKLGNEVAAVTEASDAVSSTADAIAKAGQDPVKMLAGPPNPADYTANVGGPGMNQGFNVLTDAGRNITPEQMANVKAQTALGNAQSTLDTARLGVSPTDQIGSVFTEEGAKAGLEAFMKPEAILPTAIGAGNLAQMEAMEIQNALGKEQEAKRRRRREMDRGVLSGAAQVAQPNNPFAGVFNKPGLSAFNT
jgi:hypothetical protein